MSPVLKESSEPFQLPQTQQSFFLILLHLQQSELQIKESLILSVNITRLSIVNWSWSVKLYYRSAILICGSLSFHHRTVSTDLQSSPWTNYFSFLISRLCHFASVYGHSQNAGYTGACFVLNRCVACSALKLTGCCDGAIVLQKPCNEIFPGGSLSTSTRENKQIWQEKSLQGFMKTKHAALMKLAKWTQKVFHSNLQPGRVVLCSISTSVYTKWVASAASCLHKAGFHLD